MRLCFVLHIREFVCLKKTQHFYVNMSKLYDVLFFNPTNNKDPYILMPTQINTQNMKLLFETFFHELMFVSFSFEIEPWQTNQTKETKSWNT